jgi:hypothetical protein
MNVREFTCQSEYKISLGETLERPDFRLVDNITVRVKDRHSEADQFFWHRIGSSCRFL